MFKDALYVRYVPYPQASNPDYTPLGADPTKGITALREDRFYRVLNVNDYLNETEMFFAISTDDGAICMFSNRYFRLVGVVNDEIFSGVTQVYPAVIKNDVNGIIFDEMAAVNPKNWIL